MNTNSQITFIEKEPYRDNSLFTGGYDMYPTYMVKDGKEYFMFNRRDPDDRWSFKENEARKKQLLSTNGTYFRFNGFYENPLHMLAEIVKRKHHFTDPKSMYYDSIESYGYIDFHNNRKEVSAAFYYRIYDPVMASNIQKFVDLINAEQWEDVELAGLVAICEYEAEVKLCQSPTA